MYKFSSADVPACHSVKSNTLVWCVWLNPTLFVVPGEAQPMEGSGAPEHTPAANQTNADPAAAVEPEVGWKEWFVYIVQTSC